RRALRVEGALPLLRDAPVGRLGGAASAAGGGGPWGPPGAAAPRPPGDGGEGRGTAPGRALGVLSRGTPPVPWARRSLAAPGAVHPVVLVEMGWPAAWRPTGAVAYVAAHGASRATSRAVADLLFG